MKIYTFLLCCCISFSAFAQIDYSESFVQKLEDGQLMFIEPIEGKYKDIATFRNEWWNFDLALKSKKEKIEIRYAIHTDTKSNGFDVPQIRMMQLLSNVATNNQKPIVAIHSIPEAEIKKDYNADWAAIAYFTPKVSFAYKDHCKVLTLHKDGVATVFVFFLFDKPTDELDNMMYTIRFKDLEEEY